MIIQHIKDTVPGISGLGATGTGAFVSWVTTDGLPLVHFFASLGTAVAGFATGIYYLAKWRHGRSEG